MILPSIFSFNFAWFFSSLEGSTRSHEIVAFLHLHCPSVVHPTPLILLQCPYKAPLTRRLGFFPEGKDRRAPSATAPLLGEGRSREPQWLKNKGTERLAHMEASSCLHKFYGAIGSKRFNRLLRFSRYGGLRKNIFGQAVVLNCSFCKETFLLKWMMLSKAGAATKYLLSHRDHNVPWFIWIIKMQYCTIIIIAQLQNTYWQCGLGIVSTSLFNGWLLQQRRGNLCFRLSCAFQRGKSYRL